MAKFTSKIQKRQFWLSLLLVVSTLLTVVAHGAHADVVDAHLESIDCKLCQHNIDVETPTLQVAKEQAYSFGCIQPRFNIHARLSCSVVLPPLRAPPFSNK